MSQDLPVESAQPVATAEKGPKKWLKTIGRWALKFVKWFFILSIGGTIVFRFVPIPFTPLMLQRSVEGLFSGKGMTWEKDWVSMDQISPNLQLAVVCSEDQNFLEHDGLDFDAIEDAMKYNEKQKKKGKKKMRGASTISQQTAKNVFLLPARNFIRKGFEVYFTFLIETLWSKQRIMEVYLNVIEMGDGVYGAEAAAQHYFGKSAAALTRPEAALIAAILPNPRKYSASKPGKYEKRHQAWILRQMGQWGYELDWESKE